MAAAQRLASFYHEPRDFEEHRSEIYSVLNDDKHEIRLLTLYPGSFEDDVRITLQKASLDGNPTYEAVSYTWEDLKQTKTVDLHGFDYVVTTNQFEALRHLRHTDPATPRVLWMDVFCINQIDTAEKSSQVSKMGRIYAGATTTLVWLGRFDEDWIGTVSPAQLEEAAQLLNDDPDLPRTSDRGRPDPSSHLSEFNDVARSENGQLEVIPHLLRLLAQNHHLLNMPLFFADEDKVRPNPDWYKAMETLTRILRRPWWRRAWILQEVAWSRNPPMVHLGSFQIPLELFENAAMSFNRHVMLPGACCIAKFRVWSLRFKMDPESVLTSFQYVKNIFSARRLVSRDQDLQNTPLERVLEHSADFGVTDPRDYVYSVLSLVPEKHRVHVDYDYTVAEVYTLTSWTGMQSQNSLNQLAHGCFKDGSNDWHLPLWVRNRITRSRHALYPNWIDNVSSSYGILPDWDRTVLDDSDGGSLTVPCHKMRTVEKCFPIDVPADKAFHALATVLHQQLEQSGYAFDLASVIRTIFRNTAISSRSAFTQQQLDYMLWLHERLSYPEKYPDPVPDGFSAFDLHLTYQRCVTQSCLFVTSQEKRLGIGHESIKPRDILCHIRGCCVPLALRKVESSDRGASASTSAAGATRFELIDACYVDGVMDFENTDIDWDTVEDVKLV